MAEPDIPFDVSHSMPGGSRAVAHAPDQMAQAVSWLERQAAAEEGVAGQARLLGLAGGYAAILRQLDRAEALLHRAVRIADGAGAGRQSIVCRIRLADVAALGGAPHKAANQLEYLLEHRRSGCDDHHLTGAVHQHLGKALLEAGRPQDALQHLETAGELRRARGDDELLASTLAAIEAARKAL